MTTVTELIKAVISDKPEIADPGLIAEIVAERTDESDLRDFYAASLRDHVRIHMSQSRNQAIDNVRRSARSPKVAGIRNWWQALISSSVHLGDSWKQLGECTPAELRVAAQVRFDIAARNQAQGEFYERLASVCESHGVATPADLPVSAAHEVGAP